jgi:hypothetical protein
MSESKTVSNMPMTDHVRWAQDQESLAEIKPFLTESMGISQHAQKEVSLPSLYSQLDVLFGVGKSNLSWAHFQMPTGFTEQRRRLFTSKLAPFVGSTEQQEHQIQKLSSLKQPTANTPYKTPQEFEREKEALHKCLKNVQGLNQQLIDIDCRCYQYQKG